MTSSRSFIITVDTEGDNLWEHQPGKPITTRNTEFIPRFQDLCNVYEFKPVYLTNYEMALDNNFVQLANEWLKDDLCEVGIHVHAWNNPPFYDPIDKISGASYLIEYPESIMESKFRTLLSLLRERFTKEIVSHRAGRWATNEAYFRILDKYAIKIDCSMTPRITWQSTKGAFAGGSDYRMINNDPFIIDGTSILEVPITVQRTHLPMAGSWKHRIKSIVTGTPVWIRPAMFDFTALKWVIDQSINESINNPIEFMIHSSELMPGGSPYGRDKKGAERIFDRIKRTFEYIASKEFTGRTLAEFHSLYMQSM